MLYPVSVLVPTLYGRTSALLYDAAQAPHGVVLVEPSSAVDQQSERICDEVALYLRSAGISVLRLESSAGVGPTDYAANIVGSVAFLRRAGAKRVVVIASAHGSALRWMDEWAGDAGDGDEVADRAFEGFLDLITERAATPSDYARLIAELVDTIRDVIGSVVGVVHLLPLGGASWGRHEAATYSATANYAIGSDMDAALGRSAGSRLAVVAAST